MSAPARGSSADTQDKGPLLDKDMGKEFLSSWKSMSMTADDPMDFSFEPPANNKKKTFNFEKLDMGFDLDGDFGKLSSFKVDMPDFDFSSPSKKTAKTKESSDDKSNGNSKQKKDLFSFSFDFNELDGFDLDSNLQRKGSETSSKTMDCDEVPCESKRDESDALDFDSNLLANGQAASGENLDVKATASEKKEKQISKTSDTVVIDNSTSTKQAALESMETSKLESPQGSRIRNSKADTICLEPQFLGSSPDKTSFPMIEEIDEQRPSSSIMAPSSSHTSETAQAAVDGETGPDVQEVCRSGTKEDSPRSPDQNAQDNTICTMRSSQEKIEPKISSQLCTAVQDMTGHEQNETVTDTLVKIVDRTRTTLSDPDTGSFPTAFPGKLPPDTCVSQNVQMQDPSTELLMTPSGRVLKLENLKPAEKAGAGSIRSRFFKRPDQTESQTLQPSPNRLEFLPVSKERAGLILHPANSRSAKDAEPDIKSRTYPKALPVLSLKAEHANTDAEKNVENISTNSSQGKKIHRDHLSANTVDSGDKLVDVSKLQDKSTTKERSIVQMSDKDSSSQVDASSPTEKMSKLLASGAESLHKSKISSLERPKFAKIVSDAIGAKTLRTIGAAKDPSDPTLQREVESSIYKEKILDVPGKKSSEIHHLLGRDKTQILQLSSLKRKALDEDPNVGVSTLKPLKRFSMSPSESRNPDEFSRRGSEGKLYSQENRMESTTKSVTCNSPNPGLETRQRINVAELEIPVTENDDNVEKAEAYAKELENICNILRKKHEEAKELLVRAVVNNNNLLMLNHPLYEQKIRMVQKFAAKLTSKELLTQSETMVA